MIKERYVSFEVAKMLKEKGFNEPCRSYFIDDTGDYRRCAVEITNEECSSEQLLRPTLYMTMEWLRKKHKLLISIFPMETAVGIETLCYGIWRITEDLYQPLYCGKVDNLVDSYEAAVDAAIRYSLENLI